MYLINDKTIDKYTAKYWCIFADKRLQEHLKQLELSRSLDESLFTVLGYLGYAITAYSIGKFFMPYLKNMWRKCFSGDDMKLAEVKFTADDADYTASFSLDDMKWKMHSNISITEQDAVQFFETEFFKRFNDQCKAYICPVLASRQQILDAIDSKRIKIDRKYEKFMRRLLDNAEGIEANMFDPHYIT